MQSTKDIANALFDRYEWGALEVANKTWAKYRGTSHGDRYEKVWWYILDRMPGDELALRFSTNDLAMIATAKAMRSYHD